MSSMKSKLGSLMMAAAMMGGMTGMGGMGLGQRGTGNYEPDPYQRPLTDEQRKMFTRKPKLNKKQKAKRKR